MLPTSSRSSVLPNSRWCRSKMEDPCSLARGFPDLRTHRWVDVLRGRYCCDKSVLVNPGWAWPNTAHPSGGRGVAAGGVSSPYQSVLMEWVSEWVGVSPRITYETQQCLFNKVREVHLLWQDYIKHIIKQVDLLLNLTDFVLLSLWLSVWSVWPHILASIKQRKQLENCL